MSPELGIALIVTLLGGPTALWITFSRLHGYRRRHPSESSASVPEPVRSSQLTPAEFEALVGSDGLWVCGTCRSLNRREANRCYSCRTRKGMAGRQAPREPAVSRGVPVMAQDLARSSREPAVSRGVPVMAQDLARSSREAAGTPVAIATARSALPGPEVRVPAPEHVLFAGPPEASAGPPVCPFLGWRADPSTRYDFPDPGNRCHATSERGVMSVASPRQILTGMVGTERAQPISVRYQESRCLTAAHNECARYPAAEGVATSR